MRLAFNIIGLLLSFCSFAQVPNYYKSLDFNKKGDAFKQELTNLITTTHTTELVYTPGVWNTLKNADVDPNNASKVMLLYGYNDTDNISDNDKTRDRQASCHTSNCNGKWVREHVFPRSKGTPNLEFEGPGSDAHHLHAIDYDRNSSRSNYKFIANPTSYITYSRVIQQNGTDYFYPGDEWKGDVARMIMYMYVRYGNQCQPINVGAGGTSFSPYGDMPNIFLIWNAEDPVSAHELKRNEEIYQAQGNRNPFIDNPYLATKIWNGPTAENTWKNLDNTDNSLQNIYIYPTITNGSITIENAPEKTAAFLYDMSGRSFQLNVNENKIDISSYAQGFYQLQLKNQNSTQIFKILKK